MNKIKYLIVTVFVIGLMSLSSCVHAASLKYDVIKKPEKDSKSMIVDITLNTDGDNINVVEGNLNFSGEVTKNINIAVENGNSVLSIWPKSPEYSSTSKSIDFTGGIPGGFKGKGLLFRLIIDPSTTGDLGINHINGRIYLNDGLGTMESMSPKTLKIGIDSEGNSVIQGESSGITMLWYVIIILLIICLLFVAFKYVHKKDIRI